MIQSLETNSSLFSSTTTECLLLRRVSFENSHIWVQCVILPFVLCVIKNVDVLIKLCWENSRWLSISALPQRFSLLRKIAESIQRCQFCFMRWNTLDPSIKRSCTGQNLLPAVQVLSFNAGHYLRLGSSDWIETFPIFLDFPPGCSVIWDFPSVCKQG